MDELLNVQEICSFLLNFDKSFWNEAILQLAIIGIRYAKKIKHDPKKWIISDLINISDKLKNFNTKLEKKGSVSNSIISHKINKYSKKTTSKKNSIITNFFNKNNELLLSEEVTSPDRELEKKINIKCENKHYNKIDNINKNNISNIQINKEKCKEKVNYSSSTKELPMVRDIINTKNENNNFSNCEIINKQKEIEIENNNFQADNVISSKIDNKIIDNSYNNSHNLDHILSSEYNNYTYNSNKRDDSKSFIRELRNVRSKNKNNYLKKANHSIIPNCKKLCDQSKELDLSKNDDIYTKNIDKNMSFVLTKDSKIEDNTINNKYLKIPNKTKKNKNRSESIGDINENGKYLQSKKIIYKKNDNKNFLGDFCVTDRIKKNSCKIYSKYTTQNQQEKKESKKESPIKDEKLSGKNNEDDSFIKQKENINNNTEYFFKY